MATVLRCPPEIFYQRMLAGDPTEAAEKAEEFLKERSLSSYYDEVALKGLQLAQVDAERGVLDRERTSKIKDAVSEFTINLSEQGQQYVMNVRQRYTYCGAAESPVGADQRVRGPTGTAGLRDRRAPRLRPVPGRCRQCGGRASAPFVRVAVRIDRHERLVHACALARHHPVQVDEAPAGEWLDEQLAETAPDDTVTVVWQSITRMYWPAEESVRVDAAVAEAAQRQCVAHAYDGVHLGRTGSNT